MSAMSINEKQFREWMQEGKTVVVVGGGNPAAADALILSRVARKVILVYRRDTLRATKVYHDALFSAANIKFRWNSTAEIEKSR